MEQVNETLEFLQFAIRPDATYDGVVVFVLHDQDQVEHIHSVRVRDGSVTIGSSSSASTPSCIVRCAQDTFLGVYSGEVHPRTAILGGRLHVDGFNYGELRRFLMSFDFSSAKWRDFYRARDAQAPSASAILASWRSMLVPTAQAQSASRALHLSRRLLTQSRISEVAAAETGLMPTPMIASMPKPTMTVRGHTPETAARALQAMIRHPILAVAREHADFMYRLL